MWARDPCIAPRPWAHWPQFAAPSPVLKTAPQAPPSWETRAEVSGPCEEEPRTSGRSRPWVPRCSRECETVKAVPCGVGGGVRGLEEIRALKGLLRRPSQPLGPCEAGPPLDSLGTPFGPQAPQAPCDHVRNSHARRPLPLNEGKRESPGFSNTTHWILLTR